jgi:hypothetical protein
VRDDLPTGTVTFLFTDVEGSTKLLDELGAEAYALAVAEHRRVVRDAAASHGGIEVDTQGDAFFFAFASAPEAVAAAEEITEVLARATSTCASGCTPDRLCSPMRVTSETTCTSPRASARLRTGARSYFHRRHVSSSVTCRSPTLASTA